MHKHRNSDYIHHQDSRVVSLMREIVFGMEDGMVSTLGALTGIAVGSGDQFIVILSGTVIIAVESISMGVGSYIANLSERDIIRRKIFEEKEEIDKYPREEKEELEHIFVADGWPNDLAKQMAEVARGDKKLMLKEMAYRELNVSLDKKIIPLRRGLAMFFSYIVGGLIPLLAYFFVELSTAIYVSIVVALIGLFVLGAITAKYTKGNWVKTGLRIFVLGSVALIMGYLIGRLASLFLT